MKDLIAHIDALILEYDCVIIPGFGGFVLNRESASIGDTITPPKVTVGFNPALKHNDGLLAESYMNAKSVSYDTACKLISDAVKKINAFLHAKQAVNFPRIGTFSLNEESQVIFAPIKKAFSHPEILGYSSVSMKRLTEIIDVERASIKATKKLSLNRVFAGAAAVAAAVLVFFITSTPIQETSGNDVQRSGFFTDKVIPTQHKTDLIQPSTTAEVDLKDEPAIENIAEPIKEASQIVESVVERPKVTPVEVAKVVVKQPKYYIIVGSSENNRQAENSISKLKAKGFNQSVIVASSEKIRLAVASFENRNEAERYLDQFRANNKQYSDAWLLVKRR